MRHIDGFQTGTVSKAAGEDGGDTIGKRYRFQAFGNICFVSLVGTSAKDISEPRNFLILIACTNKWQCDLDHFIAFFECADADDQILLIGIGDCHLGQLGAQEGVIADIDQRFRGSEFTIQARVGKGIIIDALNVVILRDGQLIDLAAAVEGKVRDLHDTVGSHDILQVDTTQECAFVDALQLVILSEDYRLQVFTVGKGIVINGHHALGNGDFGDILCLKEGPIAKGQDIGIRMEQDLRKLTLLKGTKADLLHASRNHQATGSACRHRNQLPAALGQQQAVHSGVVGVVGVHAECLQVRECNETVFADVGHIGRNMQFFQTGVVEGVAHQTNALVVAEGDTFQGLHIVECVMVHQSNTVRQGHGDQFCLRKGLLGDLCNPDAAFKDHTGQAAFQEHAGAHRSQRCGQSHRFQVFGALKGVLLHHRQLGAGGEGKCGNICVGKGLSADEGHISRNDDACQIAVGKGLCLDAGKGIRQNDGFYSAILERTATNLGNRRTKVKGSQIDCRSVTQVFNNGNIAALQNSVTIVAILYNRSYAYIVAPGTMIPVFVQIGRQLLIGKVEVQLICAQEGIATDVLHIAGDRQLRQALAAVEGIPADVGHGFRQIQGVQAFAETESKVIDIGQLGIAKVDVHQPIHALQAMGLDAGQSAAGQEGDALQIVAAVKHIGGDALQLAVFGERNGGQIHTALKSLLCHGGHIGRYSEAGKAGICECAKADSGQLGGLIKADRIQIPVIGKAVSADLEHVVRNMDILHIFTVCKTIL